MKTTHLLDRLGINPLTSKSPLWLLLTAPYVYAWAGSKAYTSLSSANRVDRPAAMPGRQKTTPLPALYDWLASVKTPADVLQLEQELVAAARHYNASGLIRIPFNGTFSQLRDNPPGALQLDDLLLTHAAVSTAQAQGISFDHLEAQLSQPIDVTAEIHALFARRNRTLVNPGPWTVSVHTDWEKYSKSKTEVSIKTKESFFFTFPAVAHPGHSSTGSLGTLCLTADRFQQDPEFSEWHDEVLALAHNALQAKTFYANPNSRVPLHLHTR